MTTIEIQDISDKAKVLSALNVTDFLAGIKAKAEQWKQELSHGS